MIFVTIFEAYLRFFYPFRVIYRCAIIENLVVSIHCRRILKNLQVIRATNVCANIKNFDIFQPLVGVFWDSLHYLDNLWMCYYSHLGCFAIVRWILKYASLFGRYMNVSLGIYYFQSFAGIFWKYTALRSRVLPLSWRSMIYLYVPFEGKGVLQKTNICNGRRSTLWQVNLCCGRRICAVGGEYMS